MKGENDMDVVAVKFDGTPNKKYYFNTKLNLMKDGIYEIVVDNVTTYNNRVKVVYIYHSQKSDSEKIRTITDAKLILAPPKPEKPYKKIIVNAAKEIICVLWKDGTKTIMKPQPDDEFDIEKGIAMCFMKKAYQNRGCFNDVFRDVEII